jgi:CubicO group peptidase (beta-lactamase class C family)/D-alanyl-D-alanine dipeptidase
MRSLIGWLAALLVASSLAQAQTAVPPADPYKPVVERLTALIERERTDKQLPAVSIALIDDQRIVWAQGFGHQDRDGKTPATAETVYRVGSVSKLFTDVAIMQLVEEGKIDIDAPVTKYLTDFKPAVKEEHEPITLRMLMAHRSGLIREPPVGNYFDDTTPSLAETVLSLNGIPLIYPPGERIKYSNAGIAAVGRTLEMVQGEKFEPYLKRRVLDPLGMTSSAFEPLPEVTKNLADAIMWTYHGREFPAPTFELGMAPAGSMYSTVLDLSKFASCLFADGKTADGKQLLKRQTIAAMFKPQFVKEPEITGFGIGFSLNVLDGHKRVGHGGAVYGFSTELALLPEEKLGAVVVSSRDVSNGVTTRVANDALRLMLATKANKPLPELVKPEPLDPTEARKLAGLYRSGGRWIELIESFGQLYALPDRGGYRVRLRKLSDDELIVDDAHAFGNRITRQGDKLIIAGLTYSKEPPPELPPEPPARWKGLIGEYGWDHNVLYIYERAGQLHALIEWQEVDPLTEESENVFAFPPRGLYHGEKLVFTRDATGRATQVEAASVVFKRRKIDAEDGETFKITPQRPLDELRKEALAATPPQEDRDFRKPELVDLATIDPTIKFDIRYATDNNFLGTPFYTSAKAYLQKPAADALGRVHRKLKNDGYGLLIFDAYRPWHVTKMFWEATPEKFRGFVADPSKGSRHNRGCAVDLGLYDLKTGQPVEMVAGFDEFSDRAYPDFMGGTSRQRWHRDLLRRSMEAEGFTVYEAEWWHFDYKDWREYPILNQRFEELAEAKAATSGP